MCTNNLYIFVCHYTPLIERKKFILDQLETNIGNIIIKDLDCEFDEEGKEYKLNEHKDLKPTTYVYFVRKYDRDYLTDEIKNKFFISPQDSRHNIRLEYYTKESFNEKEITYENFTSSYKHSLGPRKRRLSEESLALKHYECCRLISNMDISYGLIIEDDCVFTDNFLLKLNEIIKEFPKDWDIYIPNSNERPGFKLKSGFIELNNTNKLRIKNHPSTVYSSSILVTKKAAGKISKEIEKNKIWSAIDHEFNWIYYKLKLKVIWNWKSPKLTFWGQSGFKTSL